MINISVYVVKFYRGGVKRPFSIPHITDNYLTLAESTWIYSLLQGIFVVYN